MKRCFHRRRSVCAGAILLFSFSLSGASPVGAKSKGMAGVGYSIGMDGTSPSYNPGILGIKNDRWHGGEVYFYYEPILQKLTRSLFSVAYQPERFENVGFSAVLDRFSFGEIQATDAHGKPINADSYDETCLSLAVGYAFGVTSAASSSAGIEIKWIRVAEDESFYVNRIYASSFIADIGYALKLGKLYRLATVVENLGYSESAPARVNLAVGIEDAFAQNTDNRLSLKCEFAYRKYISGTENYSDNIFAAGLEALFSERIAVRIGYSTEKHWAMNYAQELTTGAGLCIYEQIELDVYKALVVAPDRRLYNNYGFSISLKSILPADETEE